jgi:NAD/NADP transhydrogenase alpha subunit
MGEYQSIIPVSRTHSLPEVKSLQGKKAILLLGTDRHIGEEKPGHEETRVGITPEQVAALRDWLREAGVFLDFYFIQGAGARAGYSDGNYLNIGGHLVFEHQLSSLPSPDVFHALKEPSPYEAFINGPFMRIGAVHRGGFHATSGLASLFKKKNFCAIFDGSTTGGYSHQFTGGHIIPIRGSMSVFAGWIAADEVVVDREFSAGKVVVSGGGVVGTAAVERLLNEHGSKISRILIVDPSPEKCDQLTRRFHDMEKVSIQTGGEITAEIAEGANGLILAAYVELSTAPKVINLGDIERLSPGAVIVDVSIDERGGVVIPGFDSNKASLEEIEPRISKEVKALGKNITYIGDSHLPRRDAKQASEEHGKAILPYLGVLLYLSAREGGPPQAMEYIHHFAEGQANFHKRDYFNSLVYDLRQGLAYWRHDPISVRKSKEKVMENINDFLRREGISYNVTD